MRTLVREDTNGTMTVEADSASDALNELSTRYGSDVRIESVRRIRRGGIGGFFARERFELTARTTDEPDVTIDLTDDSPMVFDAEAEMDLAVEELPVGAHEAPDFGTALHDALFGSEPMPDEEPEPGPLATATEAERRVREAVARATDEQAVPADATPAWRLEGPAQPVAPSMGRVDWSAHALTRIGLPSVIVEAVAGLDPRDDLGWINALADAVAPLCTPLSDEPAMLVGSGVERIAAPLGLPYLAPPDQADTDGSLCAPIADTERDLRWLASAKGDRGLHVVVADDPWLHLLIDDPVAVSYVKDSGVVDALYVALTLGCPLGYGTAEGGRIIRLAPIDVALAIRRQVGRL